MACGFFHEIPWLSLVYPQSKFNIFTLYLRSLHCIYTSCAFVVKYLILEVPTKKERVLAEPKPARAQLIILKSLLIARTAQINHTIEGFLISCGNISGAFRTF